MAKRTLRTWAAGTAATGAVMSIAGVGVVLGPASGVTRDGPEGNCPTKTVPDPREVWKYNDWNNLDYFKKEFVPSAGSLYDRNYPVSSATVYETPTSPPEGTLGTLEGTKGVRLTGEEKYATTQSNLWFGFDKQTGTGPYKFDGVVCFKFTQDAPGEGNGIYDGGDKGVLKDNTVQP